MCAAYDASQLASGKPAVRDYASPTCGWAVRCTKAPILSVAKRSLSSESHVAWKRELGLGAYGGMELPAALYGRSALELRHGASGWDWTFTTPYRGATAVADFGDGVPAEPDGASFYDGGDGGGGAAGPRRLAADATRAAAAADGEFVAAGLESGDVVLDGGGAERRRFAADSAGVSRDARRVLRRTRAAATARAVTVADAATGAVVERVACDETVNALAGGRRLPLRR
ncbi:hypothetical protein JL720_12458 [Aureococcus anophagefferens]|nr:hypothetical protein JL720_12458 [Aureococcus anophagefferens]